EVLLADGLLEVSERAELHAALPLPRPGQNVHRDVPRCAVVPQETEHREAVGDGKPEIKQDRVGAVSVREREAGVAAEARDPLEAAVARRLEENARERRVGLDD